MFMNIFDSHTHYDDEQFNCDRDKIIGDMLSSSVDCIVHASTDVNSSVFGIDMSRRFKNYYTSVGIHPECIKNMHENDLTKLEELITHEKVVAVGEIGLDYYWTNDNKILQKNLFISQVKLANKYNKPVIVHLRNSIADGLEILKEYKPKGVIHCYSGSDETAKEILKLGMYIGFTGALTFNNSKKAKQACSIIPLDKLLLETDCPYMAPVPNRGKRCDSSMIQYTAQAMAEIKDIDTQQLLDITNANAKKLFNIA